MKISIIACLSTVFLATALPAQAQPQSPPANQAQATVYVSDTLEIPLRAGASNRYKVIGAVRNGSPVEVLKVDTAKGYTQIRATAGVKGWLPSDQLTDIPSAREQLTRVQQELEQLKAQHNDLKQHMDNVVSRPDGDAMSYPSLYEEAVRLRQQLAQYRKVASDTVAIDERNKALQERTVALERELQIVQQENQALRNDNDSIRLLMGAVLLGAGLLIAVLMPRVREQRRTQWSRL